jgi:hypothetical protein
MPSNAVVPMDAPSSQSMSNGGFDMLPNEKGSLNFTAYDMEVRTPNASYAPRFTSSVLVDFHCALVMPLTCDLHAHTRVARTCNRSNSAVSQTLTGPESLSGHDQGTKITHPCTVVYTRCRARRSRAW